MPPGRAARASSCSRRSGSSASPKATRWKVCNASPRDCMEASCEAESGNVHYLLPRRAIMARVIGRMTLETAEALREVLEEGEAVVAALPSIGSALVLTDRRLIIIRDGRSFRPRTGVRDWPPRTGRCGSRSGRSATGRAACSSTASAARPASSSPSATGTTPSGSSTRPNAGATSASRLTGRGGSPTAVSYAPGAISDRSGATGRPGPSIRASHPPWPAGSLDTAHSMRRWCRIAPRAARAQFARPVQVV